MSATSPNVTEIILELKKRIDELEQGAEVFGTQATKIWVLIAGFLVFWMHAGFTMLEAGSVRHKNAVNIMFKNLCTVGISGVIYFLLGYSWAYGSDNIDKPSYRFIGSGYYALQDIGGDEYSWFFQFAFAATAATIVSGAVAGRVNLISYFGCVCLLTAFVYPVVSHWIWGLGGWISAFPTTRNGETTTFFLQENGGCGMIDYAGSGVVHLTGGTAAFWGAFIIGPRLGRFDAEGKPVPMPPHNIGMQTLGVFILWFGWYGFNCGSTLAFNGDVAAKVAVTTTLSPSMAIFTGLVFSYFTLGHFDIGIALNCALAGLVSITAGCSVVPDWSALIIGFIGAFVYLGFSALMKKMKIDDPVDAVAVHGACGIWGCLAVGIFSETAYLTVAYGAETCSVYHGNSSGIQFATQLIGIICIISWVTLIMVPFFLALKFAGVLRVPPEVEENGLDVSEHGGQQAFIGDEIQLKKNSDPIAGTEETSNLHADDVEVKAEVVQG